MQDARDQLKEHGYVLIKNFMSPEIIQICKSFLDLSISSGLHKPETNPYLIGEIDQILPNIFVDSILLAYLNTVQDLFQTEIIPSYVFFRQYYKDSELLIHRDRPVCEFSATILIDKDGEGSSSLCFCDDEHGTNTVEVFMEEGDAIIFSGAYDFNGKWHYRPKVEQKSITQAFLHYVSPENTPECVFPRPIHRS
jgi:hypothetical protein